MSSRPAQPEVVRRHRLRRVLAEQRRQRLDVVALEGLHVAREQRALLVVELRRTWSRSTSLAVEVGARSLERAVHRGDARLQQLGDLGRLPAQHLAAGSARRAGAAAGAGARRRRPAGSSPARRRPPPGRRRRARAAVGDRLDPGRLGQRFRGLDAGSRAGPRSIGRARRSLPSEHVEADVRRDPVQPRAERRRGPRSGRGSARRAPSSPARRPRPRTPSRASGSSSRSARGGTPRARAPGRQARERTLPTALIVR